MNERHEAFGLIIDVVKTRPFQPSSIPEEDEHYVWMFFGEDQDTGYGIVHG
jgi:hypothetical protein